MTRVGRVVNDRLLNDRRSDHQLIERSMIEGLLRIVEGGAQQHLPNILQEIHLSKQQQKHARTCQRASRGVGASPNRARRASKCASAADRAIACCENDSNTELRQTLETHDGSHIRTPKSQQCNTTSGHLEAKNLYNIRTHASQNDNPSHAHLQ